MESSEAAHGSGCGILAETGASNIPGTDYAGAQQLPECILELEGRRGKLRIQAKNAPTSYLATLSRVLLESAS